MSTEADKTYINLMILRTLATTKGRISVKRIHNEIEPKVGLTVRSIQRYLVGLEYWGLVMGDGECPQGFSLTLQAQELISDMANGVNTCKTTT